MVVVAVWGSFWVGGSTRALIVWDVCSATRGAAVSSCGVVTSTGSMGTSESWRTVAVVLAGSAVATAGGSSGKEMTLAVSPCVFSTGVAGCPKGRVGTGTTSALSVEISTGWGTVIELRTASGGDKGSVVGAFSATKGWTSSSSFVFSGESTFSA